MAKTLGTERHKALIALLVEKREAAGLTQSDLAAKLGEYQSFIARLESGQRRVDVVEFLELAEILSFDPKHALDAITGHQGPRAKVADHGPVHAGIGELLQGQKKNG